MRFIDLFAGVGGFRLGMERAGHECIWSCEIDRWCQAVYRYHFGEAPAGDARGVRPEEIPDFDLLCAGFPCQSFSLAGKRGGFEDTRGTLFYEICRIARAKKPTMLLLENVRGLLSSNTYRDFAVILESLGELGYDAEWQVLNSKDHGVPQNRERVFVVGHLGGFGGRQVFPVGEGNGDDFSGVGEARRRDNSLSITAGYRKQHGRGTYIRTRSSQPYRPGDYAPALRKSDKQEVRIAEGGPMSVGNIYPSGGEAGRIIDSQGIYPTMKWGKRGPFRPAILDNARIRRLTPRECERLQGFPDDWTRWGIDDKGEKVEISDTQRYRMMGNAVTVNVVEFIARRLPKCDYFTELGDHLYGGKRRSIGT